MLLHKLMDLLKLVDKICSHYRGCVLRLCVVRLFVGLQCICYSYACHCVEKWSKTDATSLHFISVSIC